MYGNKTWVIGYLTVKQNSIMLPLQITLAAMKITNYCISKELEFGYSQVVNHCGQTNT